MTQPTLDQLVREWLDSAEAAYSAEAENYNGWAGMRRSDYKDAMNRLDAATAELRNHGRRALLSTPTAKLVEACRLVLNELDERRIALDGYKNKWMGDHIERLSQVLADYDQEQLNPYNPAAQKIVIGPGDIEHHQRGMTNPQE